MIPSQTVFVHRIMTGPVPIRNLSTGLILTLLGGSFGLSATEVIGLQSEVDRRRERRWERFGRQFHKYAPRLNDATARAFGTGYFDSRYFDHQDRVTLSTQKEAPVVTSF